MSRTYAINEIFYSIQGEGALVGTPAVFVRFAGCNLWDGTEGHREAAICSFCDTDFRSSTPMTASEIATKVNKHYSGGQRPLVILTGGEPLLQVDAALVETLRRIPVSVALETNGTRPLPCHFDWVCFSPKPSKESLLIAGDELKLVYPQPDCPPERYANLKFRHFFIQPMDGAEQAENTKLALAYCLKNPQWRLSLQLHKFLGIR